MVDATADGEPCADDCSASARANSEQRGNRGLIRRQAIELSANVKAVQRMLGHAKASMTLDVYADLFDDDLDVVADRLDAALKSVADQQGLTLRNHD